EPTVPAHHGGDAVKVRRRRGRIPEQLRVVMRVRIDDPRRDDEAAGIELRPTAIVDVSEPDDRPAVDRDVGPLCRCPRPVDHRRAPDHVVDHSRPSPAAGPGDPPRSDTSSPMWGMEAPCTIRRASGETAYDADAGLSWIVAWRTSHRRRRCERDTTIRITP